LVAAAIYGLRQRRDRADLAAPRLAWLTTEKLVVLGIAVIVILVIGRAPGWGRAPFQLAALAAGLALFLVAAVAARLPPLIAAIMAIAVFAMINDDYVLKLHTPRYQGLLIVAGILAYVTASPRSRLAWLMPAMLAFHVASAALTALAVFLTEAIICIRR